jgi:hypothetical protein
VAQVEFVEGEQRFGFDGFHGENAVAQLKPLVATISGQKGDILIFVPRTDPCNAFVPPYQQKRREWVMKKVFTMKELEARYSGEWVLLVNAVHNKLMEPIRGELVFHNRDRDEVYKEAHKRKDAHTAIFYVGKLPKTWWLCFDAEVSGSETIVQRYWFGWTLWKL